MPIGPRKTGSPELPRTPSTPAAAPPAKPAGTAPVSKPERLEPSTASTQHRRTAALTGAAPPPPPVSASVAVAFDSLKAPGGPAKARILDDGLDAWNARMEVIENAKTSIDASYFIVEKDPYGFAFLGGLLKKQLEGVPVRMSIDAMADTFGKHGFKAPGKGKDFLQELVNHGGEAYVYHPLYERPLDALKGDYSVLASNHDKILVADGKVGITGGRNIAQDYYANPKDLKGAWRDMDVLLDGPAAVAGLKEAFDAELANGGASHAVSRDRLGNWDKKDIQMLGAYELMQVWLKAPPFTEAQKTALRGDPAAQAALAGELVKSALAQVQADLPEQLRREPGKDDLEFLNQQATVLVTHLEARGSRARYDAGASSTHQTEAKIIDQTSAGELAADLTKAFEHDKADPANGFIEYTIQKDAEGKAVLQDGQPVTVFGPEHHLSPELLETYRKKSNLWGNFVRNHVPQFKPLRHDG